ncbi:MAG: type I 3-dehydroquinate dehydratase [Candidatus Roizmanbacteria bacterium]|nr:type I 3-dehydroquinate dehydratase [Candidatus Roizmanbacteria bacterium]
MNKIKICVPVIGKTLNEFLKNLDKVQEASSMVELRVDGLNLTQNDLILIRKRIKKETILTSRNKEIILSSLNLGFDFVDVDLLMMNDLKLSKNDRSRIIVSFHDHKKTPGINRLKLLVDKMRKFGSGVIKIATVINDDQDVKNLFQILLNKKENEKMIIIGMGRRGQITRIFGPFLGSFLTFASTPFGKTASGQIDINKMKKIYEILNF